MEIEQVAAENPAAILKEYIDPGMGLEGFQARKLAFALGLKGAQISQAVLFMTGLYRFRKEMDSLLMEDELNHPRCARYQFVRARCES